MSKVPAIADPGAGAGSGVRALAAQAPALAACFTRPAAADGASAA